MQSFGSVIELEPLNADMYFQRGMCRYELKKYKEALQDMSKAFELNSNQPVYFLGRAQIYKATGEKALFLNDINEAKARGLQVPEELLKYGSFIFLD